MTSEDRARKLIQHVYHMEDLCDDADSIPLWAIKDAEAAIQHALAVERRKVGKSILNPNKLNGKGIIWKHGWEDSSKLITEERIRRICGMEGDDG